MVYCKELKKAFEDLATELAAPKDHIKPGKRAMQSIFEFLKSKSITIECRIDRFRLAGSLGKRTGISRKRDNGKVKNPDFDCVFFINNEEPPFDDRIKEIANIIKLHPSVPELKVKVTDISIQFPFINEEGVVFSFDLLPAANFVKTDKHSLNGQNVSVLQKKLTLQKLSEKQKKALKETNKISTLENRLYSSSLSEMSVACVRDEVKSEFHLKVIRLAKFWIDGTILKEYVSAKSYMIELIAIHAQRKRKNKRCLVSGFHRFLVAMSRFGQLIFSINGKVLISFKNDRPVLIDVVNPFLNLAQDINTKVVEGLQFQAVHTLKILQQLKRSVDYGRVKDPIGAIFSKK